MKKNNTKFFIVIILVLLVSFSKFGFAGQQTAVPQETVDFINKTNNVLQNMNDKIKEKADLIKQGVDSVTVQDRYRLEAEITAVIAGYRQQIESITAPAKCVEFKKIIIELMDLMGQMHSALSKGDIDKYKLLAPQVTEYSSKMQEEIKKLQTYYNGNT